MAYKMPKTEFAPHPEGNFIGVIKEVIDQGMRDSTYNGHTVSKLRLSIIIEAETLKMDDGQPWAHWEWVNLSGSSKSRLTELRQKLLGRLLSDEERENFDDESEMVGKRINYMIAHSISDTGSTFANLASWSLVGSQAAQAGPTEQTAHPAAVAREEVVAGQTAGIPGHRPQEDDSQPPWTNDETPPPESDDGCPF